MAHVAAEVIEGGADVVEAIGRGEFDRLFAS